MPLSVKLALAFAGFCTLIGVMMFVAFRERKLNHTLAEDDYAGQQASDQRTALTVFGLIIGGMLLTLCVAWVVFF